MSMPIHITYFVHGTTMDNEQGVSSGWSDVELSELGVRQSLELKEKINGKDFDVVFCSDLKRATDSAKLTFEGAVPIIPDPRLRECNYGRYNGQPSSIVEPMQERMVTERFPEGESYEDVNAHRRLSRVSQAGVRQQARCSRRAQSSSARPRCAAEGQDLGSGICGRLAKDEVVEAGMGIRCALKVL